MKYADMVRLQRPDDQLPSKPFLVESSPPSTVDRSTPDRPSVDAATMPTSMVHTSTVDPSMDSAVLRSPPQTTCYRAKAVQDAHTVWEQALYAVLWSGGRGDDYRMVTAGYGTLSKLTRMSDKAIIRNLKSLEQKLAIETVRKEDAYTRTGRTYRVYSYRLILERRRAAGLDWVWKSGNGVYLKTAPSTVDTPTVDGCTEDTVTMDAATMVATATVGATSTASMDAASHPSMDAASTPLGNYEGRVGNCSRCNGTGKITYQGRERACGCQV